MQAIIPNRPAHVRPYAWNSVTVNPNPPRVGEVTRIGFPLANPGPEAIVVERIEVRIAMFGMGMPWEQIDPIDPIGPIHLAPDPHHVEEVFAEWTPRRGGHRCVRASIHVQGAAMPLVVGRNLDVIEAGAYEGSWRIPFQLGNPERERVPIMLRLGADDDAEIHAALQIAGRLMNADRPVWLRPGEVVDAELHLAARPGAALEAVRTVEAYIGDRLLDGIQVTLLRPALVAPLFHRSDASMSAYADSELALVR